jgi:hypothetical protein
LASSGSAVLREPRFVVPYGDSLHPGSSKGKPPQNASLVGKKSPFHSLTKDAATVTLIANGLPRRLVSQSSSIARFVSERPNSWRCSNPHSR